MTRAAALWTGGKDCSLVKRPWFTHSWVGRALDERAVAELEAIAAEPRLDLCGENGEYHSLVLDGPPFREGLRLAPFKVAERDGMMYMVQVLTRPS